MHEKELLLCLLNEAKLPITISIDDIMVEVMNDGDMGSLYIVYPNKQRPTRRMKECIAEKEFFDSDNIPISVTLNVDDDDDLFEIDIWKVDSSPVIKYPSCL